MTKRPLTLNTRIPPYVHPRNNSDSCRYAPPSRGCTGTPRALPTKSKRAMFTRTEPSTPGMAPEIFSYS
jgi:hypothetical protein